MKLDVLKLKTNGPTMKGKTKKKQKKTNVNLAACVFNAHESLLFI